MGLNDASLYFRNVLFANVITNFNDAMYGAIDVQNGTFNNIKYLIAQPFNNGVTLNLTNSVFANVTNLSAGSFTFTTNASYNGFYNSPSFGTTTYGSSTYPFQSIGAGNYYLTNGCLFFNQGTTNIDQVLLAGLKQRTTYPPFLYSNITVSINTTLSPQAQRDTDSIDLGYHYDPIDYLVDTFAITNATLTVTNGTAIASYNEPGVQLRDGSSIHSYGSPLYPNWFVRYTSVQEQCVLLGGTNPASGLTVSASHYSSVGPTGQFLFSQFACPAGGGYLFYDVGTNAYNSLLVQNCELWGGPVDFSGYSNTVTTLKNNLFVRTSFSASTTANTILSVSNNLFYGMAVFFYNQATPNTWQAFNNAYDSCGIYYNPYVPIGQLTNGYNAYLNCSGFNGYLGQLWPTNVFDLVTNATLAYQTGPLGTFYQPSNSPLINMGSTNSDLLGLYHYTVLTNLVNGLEIKETNSTVDIGYHYVATDANGIPIDTDADGVPDYLGDANGNGSIDPGETPWYSPPVILVQPHDQTVKVGDTATFQVQVSSAMPVTYQWRKDGITIAGATGDTLTIPNAQDAQAGSYSVLVSNGGGQTTSLDSQLVTLTLYPGSPLYTITATGVAANMALDIYGTPALGLTHGYRVCVFGSPGQSVFKFPPPSWPKGFFSADTTDDLDNDGLTFGYEHYVSGSNPATPITTSGVIPDGWKAEWGLDPTSFAVNDSSAGDPDVDGISNLNEYNAGVNSTDPFKINSSPRPVVTIASSSTSATLGGADATFVVTRTGSFSTDVTVNYTVGGSAVYNTDYQILPNPGTYYPFSIHIPIGSATAIIAVHALSTQHSVQTIIVGLVPISIADSPSPATWPYVVDPRNDRFSGTVSSVATPTFSPNGGTFAILQNVTVNCATAGAIIHYTLNGNVPTTSDPIVTGGNTVAVPYALTLEAKAFMSNPLVSSAVQSASFVITYGDTDGDGLADAMEAVFGGKPFTLDPGWKWDTDNDGLPDTYETMIGLSKTTAEPAPGLPVNYNKCPL